MSASDSPVAQSFWKYLREADLGFIWSASVGFHNFSAANLQRKVAVDILNDFLYGNPTMYEESELLKLQLKNRRKQEKKMEEVAKRGWIPVVIWESEVITHTPQKCVEKVWAIMECLV